MLAYNNEVTWIIFFNDFTELCPSIACLNCLESTCVVNKNSGLQFITEQTTGIVFILYIKDKLINN